MAASPCNRRAVRRSAATAQAVAAGRSDAADGRGAEASERPRPMP
jgi:hypothetical protein